MPMPEPAPMPQTPPPPPTDGDDGMSDMGGDGSKKDNNGVDNEAQKAAGTLSYILNDANEETLNATIKQIVAAAIKNPNMSQKLKDNIEDKINGEDDSKDEDGEDNSDENPDLSENRKSKINGLIDEALSELFNTDDTNAKSKKKSRTRPESKFLSDTNLKQNPFVSPY